MLQFRCMTIVAGLGLALVVQAQEPRGSVAGNAADVKKRVDQAYPALDKLYKTLHTQPEVSFQEAKTSERLASEMEALGFQVTRKVGGNGIVCIFKNGAGPTVLVRTDMDALPVTEQT